MALFPYAKTAKYYAEAVVAGKIPGRRWVNLACQRQLDDLAHLKGKDAAYRFNPKLRDRGEGRAFHPADTCAPSSGAYRTSRDRGRANGSSCGAVAGPRPHHHLRLG